MEADFISEGPKPSSNPGKSAYSIRNDSLLNLLILNASQGLVHTQWNEFKSNRFQMNSAKCDAIQEKAQ